MKNRFLYLGLLYLLFATSLSLTSCTLEEDVTVDDELSLKDMKLEKNSADNRQSMYSSGAEGGGS